MELLPGRLPELWTRLGGAAARPEICRQLIVSEAIIQACRQYRSVRWLSAWVVPESMTVEELRKSKFLPPDAFQMVKNDLGEGVVLQADARLDVATLRGLHAAAKHLSGEVLTQAESGAPAKAKALPEDPR